MTFVSIAITLLLLVLNIYFVGWNIEKGRFGWATLNGAAVLCCAATIVAGIFRLLVS